MPQTAGHSAFCFPWYTSADRDVSVFPTVLIIIPMENTPYFLDFEIPI